MTAITVVRLPYPGYQSDPIERVISTVGRVDLDLAQRLHHPDEVRPYSVVRRQTSLDVIACQDDIAQALLSGEPAARLIRRVRMADFCQPAGGKAIWIAFTTPTRFRTSDNDHLIPEYSKIYRSLTLRWNALGWLETPELPDVALRRIAVAPVGDLLQRPGTGAAGERRLGFLGLVRFDLWRLEPEQQAIVWTLFRFGEYRGVGHQTGYGYGRLRILAQYERWREGDPVSVWETPAPLRRPTAVCPQILPVQAD